MRAGKVVRNDLRDGWNMRKAEKEKLNPRREYRKQHQHNSSTQERWPNPDAKAAIWRIMDGCVRRVKRDHRRSPTSTLMYLRDRVPAVRSAAVVPTNKW